MSLTILCVDDQKAVLTTLALVLKSFGYTVLTSTSFDEALSIFKSTDVDVVLLDHALNSGPPEDGPRAFKTIKPDVPVIVHSGNVEVVNAGVPFADRVLAKPVSPEQWPDILRSVTSKG
jgi:CheY-like chemotaxis protein